MYKKGGGRQAETATDMTDRVRKWMSVIFGESQPRHLHSLDVHSAPILSLEFSSHTVCNIPGDCKKPSGMCLSEWTPMENHRQKGEFKLPNVMTLH